MDERDERKRTSDDASKRTWTTSKPGSPSCSGMSVEDTCLLTTRCPVFRRRDSHLGFRMELETLAGHAKGKGTSGRPARPKVPMGQSGADRPIVAMKRGNARGAKGVGHSRRCWVNGRPEEPSRPLQPICKDLMIRFVDDATTEADHGCEGDFGKEVCGAVERG